MATTSSSMGMVKDAPNGGFYKCEECCKSFNRMASYEAHIRMHAQNEQDVLDVVFSYSEKIHQDSSCSGERRETRSKTRNPRRRSNAGSIAEKRPCVVEEPRRVQSQVSSSFANVTLIDLLTGGQSSAVSSTGGEGGYASTPQSRARPLQSSGSGILVWCMARGGVFCVITTSFCSEMVVAEPTQGGALVVRIPLRLCSRSLLRGPVINLTKQNIARPLFSQKQEPTSVELPASLEADVNKRRVSLSQSSRDWKPELEEFDHSPVKDEVKESESSLPVTPQTPKSRVVRLDSLGLPKSPDTPSTLSTPVGKPLSIKSRRNVTTSTRYQCQTCHRLLSSKSALKRHNMIHTGERPYKCSMCDRSFTQPHHRLNHELAHWAVPSGTVVSDSGHCTGGSVSSSLSGSSPENEGKILRCRFCNVAFSNLRRLRDHLTIHDTKRRFACSICGMKFMKSAHLTMHMQMHTTTPQFCCPYCDREFYRTQYYEDHLLTHENRINAHSTIKYNFFCKHCPKRCISLAGLSRHMAVHALPETKLSGHSNGKDHSQSKQNSRIKHGAGVAVKGEVLGRNGEEMSGDVPLIREILPEEEEESKEESCSTSESGDVFTGNLQLDLELDSDSDCELIGGVAPEDTATEGEMAKMSDGTAGGGTSEEDGLVQVSADKTVEQRGPCEVMESEKNEESSDGEETMSPLRLDSSEEESEEEEGEEEKDLTHSLTHSKNAAPRSAGARYRNPHNHRKGKGGADPQYKCEWCGRMFLRQYYLNQHYKLHQQVPHQCQYCGKVFMSLRYLKRHLRSRHDTAL